jgi:hypothetical protein
MIVGLYVRIAIRYVLFYVPLFDGAANQIDSDDVTDPWRTESKGQLRKHDRDS